VYEFQHGPEAEVYMDPRLEVTTQQTFQDWERASQLMAQGDREWESIIRDDEGTLPVVLVSPQFSLPAVAGLLDTPDWRMVYADAAAAVFVSDAVAEASRLPRVDPQNLWWSAGLAQARLKSTAPPAKASQPRP